MTSRVIWLGADTPIKELSVSICDGVSDRYNKAKEGSWEKELYWAQLLKCLKDANVDLHLTPPAGKAPSLAPLSANEESVFSTYSAPVYERKEKKSSNTALWLIGGSLLLGAILVFEG